MTPVFVKLAQFVVLTRHLGILCSLSPVPLRPYYLLVEMHCAVEA